MYNILAIIILACLYYLAGIFSLDFLSGHKIVNLGIFASEGIALAFALYFGKKVIPGIFIGQFIFAYANGIDILPTFMISSINSIEALLAIYLFKYFKLNRGLKHFRDVVGLSLIIVFILQPFSALSSNIVLVISSQIDSSTFIHSTFSWWFGNVMGQLLFTPFLLTLFIEHKQINFKNYILYGIAFIIYLYIIEIVFVISNPFVLVSLTLPVMIFTLSHKDIAYGNLMSVIVAFVSSYSVYLGIGAFSIDSTINNIINYNLFVLAHISIVFTTGILFEERKRFENSLQDLIDKEVLKNQEQQLLMLQQSRLAQMGEMISMIAHQWRQPLNNLSLVNQLLILKYKKNDLDDDALEYFKKNSKKQIELMTNTIDDFRNFFKSQKEKSKFYIDEAIANVLDMVEAIYSNSGVKINFEESQKYKILANQNALTQVILNILNNARDALVDNNIQDKHIDITVFENEDDIIISIKDNAGGIDKDIIDKVFDPYFSTKQDKNGTGLGLYMSKMIIQEQLNAKIDVVNNTDGANFRIYLKKENVYE